MTKEGKENGETPDKNVQWDVCLMSFVLGQYGIRFWCTVGLRSGDAS